MPAALVTGAARRLGRAIALTLADRGYDVVIHYGASKADAEETAAAAEAKGVRAAILSADILDREAVDRLVPAAVETIGGPLTVLVNNASIFEHDDISTLSHESWDRHARSNLEAPVFLTQAFAAQCPKGAKDENGEAIASGNIINMIDQRVWKLTPEFTTYTLAKAGLWAFTQTAAQALAPDIRVNGIGPGPTMQATLQTADNFAKQRRSTLLGRGASGEEIAAAVRFLLDAPGITGQLLAIDGGQHLAWKTVDALGLE